MSGRVSHRTTPGSAVADPQRNLAARASRPNGPSGTTKIAKPSDDPAGTATAIALRAALRANQQATRNIGDANGWLTAADTALGSSLDAVHQARDLTVQGANVRVRSASAREALALQVEGIRDTLVARSNAVCGGRSVFAGTSDAGAAVVVTNTPDPAVPGSTRTYAPQGVVGSSVERRIDPHTLLRVDVDGTKAFGRDGAPGSGSVFQTLDRIARTMRDGGDIWPELAALDGHRDALLTQLCGVGARQSRALGAEATALATTARLTTHLGGFEDIDVAAPVVELRVVRARAEQAACAVALGATARVLQPSLLEFLR